MPGLLLALTIRLDYLKGLRPFSCKGYYIFACAGALATCLVDNAAMVSILARFAAVVRHQDMQLGWLWQTQLSSPPRLASQPCYILCLAPWVQPLRLLHVVQNLRGCGTVSINASQLNSTFCCFRRADSRIMRQASLASVRHHTNILRALELQLSKRRSMVYLGEASGTVGSSYSSCLLL